MRFVSPRFDFFNPSFYLENVLHGDGPISVDWANQAIRSLTFDRIGAWTLVVALPLAVGTMLWRASRREGNAATLLASSLIAHALMFLVLVQVKTVNYMIALWPMAALCLAWLGVRLWDRRSHRLSPLAAAVLVVGITGEGAVRIAHVQKVAASTTPYEWFSSEVARCIPDGSLVLGLQHYWLGLRQYPFRTWLVPTNMAHPVYYHEAMTLDDALERIDPDVILIDRYMAAFFHNTSDPADPAHSFSAGYERFMDRRRATLLCVINGLDYGEMRVYRVRQPRGGPTG